MAKYNDWTFDEAERLLDIVGGVKVARSLLSGELKFKAESSTPPAPLVGKLIKTIVVPRYQANSMSDAIGLGKYSVVDFSVKYSVFAHDEVGLVDPVNVDLFQFNRKTSYQEVLVWSVEKGKTPIKPKHLFGIGINHPDGGSIVELGVQRDGTVLFICGRPNQPCLAELSIEGLFPQGYWFGFLSN